MRPNRGLSRPRAGVPGHQHYFHLILFCSAQNFVCSVNPLDYAEAIPLVVQPGVMHVQRINLWFFSLLITHTLGSASPRNAIPRTRDETVFIENAVHYTPARVEVLPGYNGEIPSEQYAGKCCSSAWRRYPYKDVYMQPVSQ